MSKTLNVENALPAALNGFKDRAGSVKEGHRAARQAIKDDPRTSDLAKRENLEALDKDTRSKLDAIKGEQESYIKGLRDKAERDLRGAQPSDANSVLLRRDAADRARKITDQREAMQVLNDAIFNDDAAMAHAIGNAARNNVWLGVAEAYTAAYPSTADAAAALAYVEGVTSGPAFNISNQMTYADPNV